MSLAAWPTSFLRKKGGGAWSPAGPRAGRLPVILEKIVKGVDRCHEAVVLISPASSRSEYVSFEIGAVQSQHKRITPVLNNVAVDAHALLKGMRSIDLNQFEDYLRQLGERIAQRED